MERVWIRMRECAVRTLMLKINPSVSLFVLFAEVDKSPFEATMQCNVYK